MKIYVLTIVDTQNYGFNPQDVEVYTDIKKANERMKSLYLARCKEEGIETPYEGDSMYGITEDCYAFVNWWYVDIFEREVEL